MPLTNRRAQKTIAIVFQIRFSWLEQKALSSPPTDPNLAIANFKPLHDDLPYMEVHRARLLQARYHDLAKITQSLFGRGVELGLSGFFKTRRALIKERCQTHSRIGGKQGYLPEKMWKSKTQDNRADGKG